MNVLMPLGSKIDIIKLQSPGFPGKRRRRGISELDSVRSLCQNEWAFRPITTYINPKMCFTTQKKKYYVLY